MNTVNCSAIFLAFSLAWVASLASDSPSEIELLSRLGVSVDSRIEELVSSRASGTLANKAFVLYRVTSGVKVRYILYTGTLNDSVDYDFLTKEEALEFFAIRFKGIANDLLHGKLRTDALSRDDLDLYAEIGYSVLGLNYERYSNAMEVTLARLRDQKTPTPNSP